MRIERYMTPPAPPPRGPLAHPVWALAFRPFFLGAAALAALLVPLWLGIFFGAVRLPLALPPMDWHLHALIFGFAGAVLVGFLLTAAKNWTGRPTVSRGPLAAIFGLWLLGRLALLVGQGWPAWLVAALALGYLPAAALTLARPLLAARNRRNYAFPLLLLALTGAGLALHVEPSARRLFVDTSVDILLIFLVVMGGRVIPFFTRNALREQADRIRSAPLLDWSSSLSVAALAALHLAGQQDAADLTALVAGFLNLVRLLLWSPWLSLKRPILWVLHLGYAWIPIGLLLTGLAPHVAGLGGSAPLHALTVGALGTLTLGMMARVSLGHTGRPLEVSRLTTTSFALMTASAFCRVALPLASPTLYSLGVQLSGALFAISWLLFIRVYFPILTRPRADGAPG